ncbi:hypothetical protein GOBAR_DD05684 [Gossypium barbadense]|nr:hypothetical protein GOBAR_DD05684 [Gossypium barbadense]
MRWRTTGPACRWRKGEEMVGVVSDRIALGDGIKSLERGLGGGWGYEVRGCGWVGWFNEGGLLEAVMGC